jgi:dTDP-4-dehydrorhamnose 3,5-epimerase
MTISNWSIVFWAKSWMWYLISEWVRPNMVNMKFLLLTIKKSNVIYIPAGLAHGYYVTSQSTIMMYKVTTVFSPENDSGILWNSLGIPWPDSNPIISDRDQELIDFEKFCSPFVYNNSKIHFI